MIETITLVIWYIEYFPLLKIIEANSIHMHTFNPSFGLYF